MTTTNETRPACEAERGVNHNNAWANPTTLPTAEDYADLPAAMRNARRWLVWRAIPNRDADKKPRKVPFYVSGAARNGALDSPEDVAQLASFDDALAAVQSGMYAGLGFALGRDGAGHWQGVDFDNVTEHPALQAIIDDSDLPGYIESSPSGNGWHAIGYGRDFHSLGSNGTGIEAYARGRFFTVTGADAGLADPVDLADFVEQRLAPMHGRHEPAPERPQGAHGTEPLPTVQVDAATVHDLRSALLAMRADDRELWIRMGHALGTLGEQGRGLWLEWSVTSGKFDPADASRVWDSIKPTATDYRAVFAEAQRQGWVNPKARAPEPEPAFEHPLSKFVELGDVPAPPRWVLPGFIAEGVCVIAGQHGAGKTTALLPLACAAAGLHAPAYPLAPKHWRHVIYVCEDVEQARRILLGLAYGLNLDPSVLADRVHLVAAARMPAPALVRVGQEYRERCTRVVDGVALLPLVVLDTAAATIELESENDNAEASRAIAALKQHFVGLPVWLIGHVSKAVTKKDAAMAMRGASAFEADAHQVLYLVKDGDALDAARWLVRNKTRFEGRWSELGLISHVREVEAVDPWGEPVRVLLRWSIAQPKDTARGVLAQQARDAAKQADAAVLRMDIAAAVRKAWESGTPINRAGVKAAVSGKGEAIGAAVAGLLDEGVLYEVEIPARERANSRRGHYLIHLTNEDRDHLRATGELPAAKRAIPPGWKKVAKVADPENADLGTTGNGEPVFGQVDDANLAVPNLVVPLGKNDGNGGNPAEAGVPPPPDSMDRECRGTAGNDGEWRADSVDVVPVEMPAGAP